MKKKPLWIPSPERVEKANVTRFIAFINKKYALTIRTYAELHAWSVDRIPEFWAAVWEFAGIQASTPYRKVVEDLDCFPGAKWFPGARINFAENLLRYRDDQEALVGWNESGASLRLTYQEVHEKVRGLAQGLRRMGVKPGDRVGAYLPNRVETVLAMLSAASVGAAWAACGTELGPAAVLDRLGQIQPKILFAVTRYQYKGKTFSTLPTLEKLVQEIPSIEKVVMVNAGKDDIPNENEFLIRGSPSPRPSPQEGEGGNRKPKVFWYSIRSKMPKGGCAIPAKAGIPAQAGIHFSSSPDVLDSTDGFEPLPFDHPLYIMFSSGTTGKPKCLVQSAGGILINHLKELLLHTDLNREDKIMYITSPTWMMWNWVVSSLAVGATVVLYDGNPAYPDTGAMWNVIEKERITIFGCSASYLNALRSEGYEPSLHHNLSSLREISQTGSPLSAEGFEWVYRAIKKDLHFNSISGGTDINGCFAAGSPTLSVYAGEIQAPALGMKIKAYNAQGHPVIDAQGELVCEAPSPSMPLYFWNDPGNEKYLDAYFRFFPGRVWRHGDYVRIHSDTGGITFYGRSDAVLKPSGVRIGTAELYRVLETLPEIADSLVVGQTWKNLDQRILLFVKLSPGKTLTEELQKKIRTHLREEASPRHVPALIFEVPDIPYTFSMKKVEGAITNLIHGRPVSNVEALVNPESLQAFKRLLPQIQTPLP